MSRSIERRSILGMLGGAAAVPAASAQQAAQGGESGDQRPANVLFILFDKCRRDAIGAYGRSDVHTPNIDRLAGGGVRFRVNEEDLHIRMDYAIGSEGGAVYITLREAF